jgi:YkoY family integral membrane protein
VQGSGCREVRSLFTLHCQLLTISDDLMLDKFLDSPLDIGASTPMLLLVLVALEAVLSADNAVALASISQGLADDKLRRQALNIGLIIAYVLRMVLILAATWVVKYWQFQLLGAGYLLWLVFQYFISKNEEDGENNEPKFTSIWQAIPTIAITDLAFSLDSVATAIAVSTDTWLVISGATIGIIILRFMAGLFIRWLAEYTHLEDAGYVTVGLVGIKLLVRAVRPELEIPELFVVGTIAIIFAWGFSQRKDSIDKLPDPGE